MEDIQNALQYLGTLESIQGVRILNDKGIVSRSSDHVERGKQITWNSSPCLYCHKEAPSTQEKLTHQRQWIRYLNDEGDYMLTLLDPIINEPDCYTAACHVHPENEKIIGLLMIDSPLDPIEKRITENIFSLTVLVVFVVATLAVILSLILWFIVIKPITALSTGMKRVSAGDLTHKVDVLTNDEVGRLSLTFNEMTDELSQARQKMERWTQSLEEEVDKKTRLIMETQDKLIQAEKYAALGRLTGEIAHEIRNPLTALGGFGKRMLDGVSTEKQSRYASVIVSEVARLEKILKDVLMYSWEPHLKFEKVDLAEIVEETILLFSDLLEEYSIKIERSYGTDLQVFVEKEHVKQAVINLVSNAIDVMPGGGTLTAAICQEEKNEITYVALHISDTGPGIPDDVILHVMEPFFSTKKIGEGTGLGLSISRKILFEQGGFLLLTNREAGGLTVSLYFPYQSDEECAKIPCWEYMQCGRDKDNSVKCPAFPHFGRVCWAVAGTLCAGKIQGTFAQKIDDCRKCEFYQSITAGADQQETKK